MTTTFAIDARQELRERARAVCGDALEMCNHEVDRLHAHVIGTAACIADDGSMPPFLLKRLRLLFERKARIGLLVDELRPMYLDFLSR